MTPPLNLEGVWFVYDGDCPICTMAAQALRIKKKFGKLTLLNAREDPKHPLLEAINDRQLDLDEGMIIFHEEKYYHGKSALHFMSKHGEAKGLFNHANRLLFWSKYLSSLLYPWIRSVRNQLLRLLNKHPIDNLNRGNFPIFQSIFGDQWESLPTVIKKHYANRPYSNDRVTVDGVMNVKCYWPIKLAAPFFRLMGSIPLITEYGVRCTVHFDSFLNNPCFGFHRQFWFVQHPYYAFRSRMLSMGGDKVIEIMRFGFCWRMRYQWKNERVCLNHDGYGLLWFGHLVPLPITWLIGRGDAEEIAIDDNNFKMIVTIKHPLLGLLYSYSGHFTVTQERT